LGEKKKGKKKYFSVASAMRSSRDAFMLLVVLLVLRESALIERDGSVAAWELILDLVEDGTVVVEEGFAP
jgi:hypothetical protein